MSNKLTDERLDKMLDDYFAREPDVMFTAQLAEEKRSVKNMKSLKFKLTTGAAVLASICLTISITRAVLMHSYGMYGVDEGAAMGVITEGDGEEDNTTSTAPPFVTSTAPASVTSTAEEGLAQSSYLFMQAYAQDMTEADMQKMKDEAVVGARDLNNLRQERLDYGKIWYDEKMAYRFSADDESKAIDLLPVDQCTDEDTGIIVEPIGFIYYTNIRLCVNGENVSHLSFKSDKDAKIVCTVPGGDYSINADTGEKEPADSYLDPTDVDYQEYLRVTYVGLNELIYDGENINNDEPFPSRETVKHLTEKRRELFKDMDAQKFNEYFGDTITVTATYTDGSESTSHIYITFDDEGNYLIDYD